MYDVMCMVLRSLSGTESICRNLTGNCRPAYMLYSLTELYPFSRYTTLETICCVPFTKLNEIKPVPAARFNVNRLKKKSRLERDCFDFLQKISIS